ncbi:MAG: hypothetical protein ABWY56_00780 [Propionibacteriaceae bacterium]
MTPTTAPPTLSETTDRRALLANSTLAFVLAAMVNDTLHELAHAVAGLAQGLTPTVSPFSVSYLPEGTDSQQIVTAAAGPLFSLVLGLVLMVVARSWGRGLVRLFFLWLSFMGVMNFVGYCFIAPFARVGDTGQVLSLLGAPGWAYVLVALVGVAGQFWLAYRFAGQVKRYARTVAAERQLAFIAWILGTLIMIALTTVEVVAMRAEPAHVFVVVFYSCAVGIFGPMQFIFRARFSAGNETLELRPVNAVGIVVTVLVAVVLVGLAFAGGVTLG